MRLLVDPITLAAQRRASDPRASAWVSANAGAGKTKVLTDRVLRLLLDGAAPGRILCLTFTKAAAANMAIRVFERLGRWVTLEEPALAAELAELTGRAPRPGTLAAARRLFARAVETPGGLKIETLHALCERLLHMFPFEANVPARFVVLDETRARDLVAGEIDNVLADAVDDAALGEALARVAPEAAGETLREAIRAALGALAGRRGEGAHDPRLHAALGLAAEESAETIEAAILAHLPPHGRTTRPLPPLRGRVPAEQAGEWSATGQDKVVASPQNVALPSPARLRGPPSPAEGGGDVALTEAPPVAPLGDLRVLAGRLRTGKDRDETLAGHLLAALDASGAERLDRYRAVFFTSEDKPKADGSLGTKAAPAEVRAALIAERERLVPLFDRLRAARAVARTRGLFTLAAEVRRRVEARKARLGALDFDDLIRKTVDLLARVGAGWVLYKLDRGVDHVLIDEAQDTSPDQWEILDRLTAEFAAGQGARDVSRTRFAVGDPKQSIYGFQGAEPRAFAATRLAWRGAALEAGLAFHDVELRLSFRSVTAVLQAVDATFGIARHFDGLSFDEAAATQHTSARGAAPGAVELWPVAAPAAVPEPDAWDPSDGPPEAGAPGILTARRVARAIRGWTTGEGRGEAGGAPRRPGDILVLVRKRGPVFEEVIRALKGAGVPVAGQDRLDVSAHIAVADLVATGRAGLLPADDLTLAVALKTPLVGFTDDDLVRVAAGRRPDETLEDALHRHARAGDPASARAAEALDRWIALAGAQGPFGFYAALLGPMEGRARLVARLGGEAGDAIDVFLAAAMRAEAADETASLTGFLAQYAGEGSHTVRRDLDAARDEVRVMTVHGAKGLEAPLVVVLDGCEPLGRKDPPLLPVEAAGGPPLPVWSSGRGHDSAALRTARGALHARTRQEHNRLLYVAMTRAADRLVIAPYRGATPDTEDSWCRMVGLGLERALGPGRAVETPHGPAMLWGEDEPVPPAAAAPVPAPAPALPGWLRSPVPPEEGPPAMPADGMRRASSREPDPAARRRGALVHGLLRHLPEVEPARRGAVAEAFALARAPRLSAAARAGIVRSVLSLMERPDLAPLFAPGSRADVAVPGTLVHGGRAGAAVARADRVAVHGDRVLLARFETGRAPEPEVQDPPAARELARCAALLAQVHPDRTVVPFVVWTAGPVVRHLNADAVAAALDAAEA